MNFDLTLSMIENFLKANTTGFSTYHDSITHRVKIFYEPYPSLPILEIKFSTIYGDLADVLNYNYVGDFPKITLRAKTLSNKEDVAHLIMILEDVYNEPFPELWEAYSKPHYSDVGWLT